MPRRRFRPLKHSSSSSIAGALPFFITVDKDGLFHIDPRGPTVQDGGPFGSLGEVVLAIKGRHRGSYVTSRGGLFHVLVFLRPHHAGALGPFRSLAEAVGAIDRSHEYRYTVRIIVHGVELEVADGQRIARAFQGYYFTMKNGLFYPNPANVGGPFKSLDETSAAIESHRRREEESARAERESMQRMHLYLSQLDPADLEPWVLPPESEWPKHLERLARDGQPRRPTRKCLLDESIERMKQDLLEDIAHADQDFLDALKYFEDEDDISEEKTIQNGLEWMREEVVLAFKTYIPSNKEANVVEYELEDLCHQCLIFDSFSRSYHHYNFVMKSKSSPSENWTFHRYFAEVKSVDEEKHYFCCPLEPNDDGHCYGCRKVGIDLKHPTNGGYEEGNVDSGFPFDPYCESDDEDYDLDSGSYVEAC